MYYMELDVWQRAVDLCVDVYRMTGQLPADEKYGLVRQMKDAGVSVPSNIAEGEGRWNWRDRAQFYYRARGSLYEVETQAVLCNRLHFVDDVSGFLQRSQAVGQMINGALRKLRADAR